MGLWYGCFGFVGCVFMIGGVGVGYCVGLVFLSIKFGFVGFGVNICCWL